MSFWLRWDDDICFVIPIVYECSCDGCCRSLGLVHALLMACQVLRGRCGVFGQVCLRFVDLIEGSFVLPE